MTSLPPPDWRQTRLGDVVTLQRGFDLPARDRRPGPIPIVSSSGVTGSHEEARINGPAVITGRYGTLGEVYYIDGPCWPLNTTLFVRDFHGNDPRFCFYFLQSQGLGDHEAAAAVPGVNRNVLHALPVVVPPVATQRKLASVLSAYDDLIENDLRRVSLLEEMAARLYREWFVDLRYPGHEHVPEVGSVLGPIPQGWAVQSISELGSGPRAVASGPFGSKLGRADYRPTGTPVIRGVNLSVGGGFKDAGFVFVSDTKADELAASMARSGDIVVTQRGTLGQVGVIPPDSTYQCYVLSQSQMKITVDPSRASSAYVYAALRSPEVTDRIKNMAISAGVPHINLTMLRDLRLPIPPLPLQQRFEQIVEPMTRCEHRLTLAIEKLRATRDVLLPRLISGHVDVDQLRIAVEEASA